MPQLRLMFQCTSKHSCPVLFSHWKILNLHISLSEIQDFFISSWFNYFLNLESSDLTFSPHCAMVSVVKLFHLQVMITATGLPTGTKKRNYIAPLSALRQKLPETHLLITRKAVHGLSPPPLPSLSIYSWTLLFCHLPKSRQESETELAPSEPLKLIMCITSLTYI